MAPLRTGDGFPDVVVTAVASTTPLAPDAEKTWQYLLEGRSGIRELDNPFVDEFKSPVRIGGPLHGEFRRASEPRRAASAVVHAENVHGVGPTTLGCRGLAGGRHHAAGGVDRAHAGHHRGNHPAVRHLGGTRPARGVPDCDPDVHAECACRRGRIGPSGQGGHPVAGGRRRLGRRGDRAGMAAHRARRGRHRDLRRRRDLDRGRARRGVLTIGHVVDQQRRSARRVPAVRQEPRRHGLRRRRRVDGHRDRATCEGAGRTDPGAS